MYSAKEPAAHQRTTGASPALLMWALAYGEPSPTTSGTRSAGVALTLPLENRLEAP